MTYFSEKNTSSSQETVKAMVAEKIEPVTDKEEPVTKKMEPVVENMKPPCNFNEAKGDICEIIGDVRIQGNSASVFLVSPEMRISEENNSSWSMRPYARKTDKTALSNVREWSVKSVWSREETPQCNKNHTVPAVLFSQGGYAGNHFHDFSDVLIPLYLTSRQYDGEVQFLITNKQPWWIVKFWEILKKLTKYELIDIDKEEQIHCFPSATVGLKRNLKELTIDASKYSYSMRDFREFLRTSYSLKQAKAIKLRDGWRKRPSLLIISRGRTRKFANLREIARMARSLGYRVSVAEATKNVSKFAQMVNSCDVLMGVHGAGLTNIMFLPENAIFIQVIPFGDVDWVATNSFGEPSKDMNLKYLEYTINKEESTLVQQYPLDHVILRDPSAIWKQGWGAFKSVYLDKQDVNIDLNRFRPTLLKALELLHQ
ncbi:Protein O-linked-mannose beta-1,4-N-acetylglucosaminyltransferase 2 [Morella rubra]|uniref:Protein O-linked-mannose beta-1,4-N-acetylglucosaminyltransferase 2 n=1 Tax=Morella rubra TaxID=262757 RepID=A0A6A1WH98_9ROSI|nr:Protein O-linked-mannose beta-1,4-N-acetylglucosaminyltransferase 2 [Morella rubra]KAB1212439.1 Protein O-linked-mannose beta-1,4-N-acetylglucosaminyltransferase 2 [Morella rubra]KAB1223776.1 Protein O-linked-mannose beta-1,4-N-acetylglucosaminyltransferase 2 [Morella rubra]